MPRALARSIRLTRVSTTDLMSPSREAGGEPAGSLALDLHVAYEQEGPALVYPAQRDRPQLPIEAVEQSLGDDEPLEGRLPLGGKPVNPRLDSIKG